MQREDIDLTEKVDTDDDCQSTQPYDSQQEDGVEDPFRTVQDMLAACILRLDRIEDLVKNHIDKNGNSSSTRPRQTYLREYFPVNSSDKK